MNQQEISLLAKEIAKNIKLRLSNQKEKSYIFRAIKIMLDHRPDSFSENVKLRTQKEGVSLIAANIAEYLQKKIENDEVNLSIVELAKSYFDADLEGVVL